jgi:ADP-dependent NAD(P)H-hydrate dehydratase / NAD(P)H-hydrate epimerase
MKVVTAEQMQKIDAAAASMGIPTKILMEKAGLAVAEQTRNLLGRVIGRSILILVGPGNNGGDGLVAARYLSEWDAEVSVYLCSPRKPDDKNYLAAKERNIPILSFDSDENYAELTRMLDSFEVVIDAIFGTGNSRPISGNFKTILNAVNIAKSKRSDLFIVAVDLPSGLNANNGTVDPCCPKANATITLGLPKPGLYSFPGADMAGKVIIADIGIPPEISNDIKTELIDTRRVRDALPERPNNANKGTFGKILVVAGSINYIGAAYLSCTGAYRAGAGLVTLAASKSLISILAAKMAETTYLPVGEDESGVLSAGSAATIKKNLDRYDALLIGCGLGQRPETQTAIRSILLNNRDLKDKPVIIDADGLNALNRQSEWWQRLGEHVILTPHPGEMARLTGLNIEDVQKNRLELALKKAAEWRKIIVLKGAYTIVASPDGRANISTLVNPGLASAGTGDVLAGIIAGLSAQGIPLFDAAACGVFLHGEAASMVTEDIGNTGMVAGDLLPAIPKVIKQLRNPEG